MNRMRSSNNDGTIPEMQSTRPRRLMVDNSIIMKSLGLKTEAKNFPNEKENLKTLARGETSAAPREARSDRVDNRFPVNNPRTLGRPEETHRQPYDSHLLVNTKQADRSINHYDMELQRKRYRAPQSQYAGKDYRNTPKTSNIHCRQSGPFRGQPERIGNNVDFRNSRIVPDNGQRRFYQNFESRQPKNLEAFKPVHHPVPNDKPLEESTCKPSPNSESPHSTLSSTLRFKSNNSSTAQQENVLPVSSAMESKENKSSPNVEQRMLPVINKPDKKESKLPPVKYQERQSVDEGYTQKFIKSGTSSPIKSPQETLFKIPENKVPVTHTVEVKESKLSYKVNQERPKTVESVELKNVETGNFTKPLSPPAKISNDQDFLKVTPSPNNDSPHKTQSAETVGKYKQFEKTENIKPIETEPVKNELTVDAENEKVLQQVLTVENNTIALLKEFQSVLDELTAECFEEMVGRVQTMQINSEEGLKGCARLTHEAAVMQPHFSETYARFAFSLSYLRASDDLTLGNALVERCQESCDMIIDSIDLELNKWPFSKKISLGNFKFLGELLNVGEIGESLVCDYLSELLSRDQDEVSIGCICKLLSTVGKTLESSESVPKLDAYFFVLESLVASGMSNEYKLMVEDLIDLRQAHWNLSSS